MKNKKVLLLVICLLIIAAILVLLFVAAPAVLRLRYKLAYEQEILKYSEQFDLEPALVCAVIQTESGFRVSVTSSAGAKGLMQIMPATGEQIASELDIADYSVEMLDDPQTNIQFGCFYLAKLIDQFDGNWFIALAAYNAGPSRAREWIDKYGLDEEGRIQLIPYPETSKYVDKVMRAYDVYNMLYEKQWKDN